MAIKEDYFDGDGVNTVFKTSLNYATNTVTAFLVGDTSITPVTIQTLGEGYIVLDMPPMIGERLKVQYTIEGTLPTDNKEEYDIKKRIVELEKAVKALHETNIALTQALNNRINISSFQAWTRLIEKKLGITLIDKNLGYISQELYTSDK